MKTAALPAIRVHPDVRAELESVLREGETLSAFVETAVRDAARVRREQAAFIARGLQALTRARETGEWYTPEQAIKRLQDKLDTAKKERTSKRRAA